MAYFSSLELARQDVLVLSGKKSTFSVQDGDIAVPRLSRPSPQVGMPQILRYKAIHFNGVNELAEVGCISSCDVVGSHFDVAQRSGSCAILISTESVCTCRC